MKQASTTLETYCKENEYHDKNHDSKEDKTAVKNGSETPHKCFEKLTNLMEKTKKIHTNIVTSLKAELKTPRSNTCSSEAINLQTQTRKVSKDELKRIQYLLQTKGITTQFAAKQELSEVLRRKREMLVKHPQLHLNIGDGQDEQGGEEFVGWKKLGSLAENHGADKPIYIKESAKIIQMSQTLERHESHELFSTRKTQKTQMEKGDSSWMLEESAVRLCWDKR